MTASLDTIAQQLLLAVKKQQADHEFRKSLEQLSKQRLEELKDEATKIAFWVNVYNAFIQIVIKEQPNLYQEGNAFYTSKVIPIAGEYISFDDIEHGMLRKRKFKYGLGYIPALFNSDFVKKHQVEKLDYRIHFALNCGAASCPPIAFYTVQNLDQELNTATSSYLEQETDYIEEEGKVYVSKLMLWFLGDFGGRTGIIKILKENEIIPVAANPKVRFKNYDWTLQLDNYR